MVRFGYRRVHYARISKVTVLGVVVQVAPQNVAWFTRDKAIMQVWVRILMIYERLMCWLTKNRAIK